jgi:hypothetical protein
MPQRIQLRRTKGWRKPEGAVVVSRPSKWGNPFKVVEIQGMWRVVDERGQIWISHVSRDQAARWAVDLFDLHTGPMGDFEWGDEHDVMALRGHDLCCWCPLDRPCHADVLLRIANAPAGVAS